ncbi:hypothetical protein Ancab_022983 [Ancistrocladus abbreviatus]
MEVQPQSSKVVAAVPDPNAALEGGRQSVPFPTQAHTVVAATRVPVVSAQHGFSSDVPDSNAAGDGGRHAAPFSTEAHVETAVTRIPDDSAQHGHSSVRFSSSQFHDSLQQRFSGAPIPTLASIAFPQTHQQKTMAHLHLITMQLIGFFALLALSVDASFTQFASIDAGQGTKWAVLVAGSTGYKNYRHQANVCHAYQILKKGGLKEENIIVFMYDDVAFDKENPRPGVLINRPSGEDVYAGVKKVQISICLSNRE